LVTKLFSPFPYTPQIAPSPADVLSMVLITVAVMLVLVTGMFLPHCLVLRRLRWALTFDLEGAFCIFCTAVDFDYLPYPVHPFFASSPTMVPLLLLCLLLWDTTFRKSNSFHNQYFFLLVVV